MSIAPSPAKLCLPLLPDPPPTVLQYLCQRFSRVSETEWRQRIARGKVSDHIDCPISADTPYCVGATIHYFREVASEPLVPFREEIIFQNEHLLVADKPHFLPVTPAGDSVNECLLYRLRKRTGLEEIAPVHRLDRETAGLVLFSIVPKERPLYARLFTERLITRKYLAVASAVDSHPPQRNWTVHNRLQPGDPWFTMRIAEGPPNATTEITLLKIGDGKALFELVPQTGKKHQLRVHMMSIGFPIMNDPYYPTLRDHPVQDYSTPMQLLAQTLRFTDPVSGNDYCFQSDKSLTGN